jgi:hypothetical protein
MYLGVKIMGPRPKESCGHVDLIYPLDFRGGEQ